MSLQEVRELTGLGSMDVMQVFHTHAHTHARTIPNTYSHTCAYTNTPMRARISRCSARSVALVADSDGITQTQKHANLPTRTRTRTLTYAHARP